MERRMVLINHIERCHRDPDFANFIFRIENYITLPDGKEEYLSGFYYAGGKYDDPMKGISHRKYFKLRYGIEPPFEYKDRCICGVAIKLNCYITDDDENFMVIGRCCITKFLPEENQGRTCSICKKPHQSNKDNFCKDCRPKIPKGRFCEECGDSHHNRKDNLCNNCRWIRDNTKTCKCGKRIDKKYEKCYKCYYRTNEPKKCEKCSKTIADKYRYCYDCYNKDWDD